MHTHARPAHTHAHARHAARPEPRPCCSSRRPALGLLRVGLAEEVPARSLPCSLMHPAPLEAPLPAVPGAGSAPALAAHVPGEATGDSTAAQGRCATGGQGGPLGSTHSRLRQAGHPRGAERRVPKQGCRAQAPWRQSGPGLWRNPGDASRGWLWDGAAGRAGWRWQCRTPGACPWCRSRFHFTVGMNEGPREACLV